MKKRGVSLLTVILIFIIIIAVILIGINIARKGSSEKIPDKVTEISETNKKTEKDKDKFSIKTLEDNGIGENTTLEKLKIKFGDLKQDDSYVKTSTGENIDEYSTNGVKLVLSNSKLQTCIITSENFEFNGIKIGDSEDKVLKSFYQEKDTGEVVNGDGVIIGKYIYGNYTIDNLDDINITENVEYAYIGNENTASGDLYNYVIQYAYMEPPYKDTYASNKDKIAYIEFGIKDGVVVSFASQVEKKNK